MMLEVHVQCKLKFMSYCQPSEPKIKPSRMLLLELTDGTQTVFGMEYQLIPFLKVTTPPGTKVTLCEYFRAIFRLSVAKPESK